MVKKDATTEEEEEAEEEEEGNVESDAGTLALTTCCSCCTKVTGSWHGGAALRAAVKCFKQVKFDLQQCLDSWAEIEAEISEIRFQEKEKLSILSPRIKGQCCRATTGAKSSQWSVL